MKPEVLWSAIQQPGDAALSLYEAGIGGFSAPLDIGITNWWVWISGTCSDEDMSWKETRDAGRCPSFCCHAS
jgi:hypothetical protein